MDTRQRIIETSAELFARNGYGATGVKQIVDEADAAFGSLYHFFPQGKEQLAAEAVKVAGQDYEKRIPELLGGGPDLASGIRMLFADAGKRLADSGFETGSPIGTVALEVCTQSEAVRVSCAEVFERWLAVGAAQIAARGVGVAPGTERVPGELAVELAVALLAALEGGLLLSRTTRSAEPLRIAGEMVALTVSAAFENQSD